MFLLEFFLSARVEIEVNAKTKKIGCEITASQKMISIKFKDRNESLRISWIVVLSHINHFLMVNYVCFTGWMEL